MKILAIETSCDETSAAVLTDQNGNIEVLSNITATSLLIHAKTGGIIPENAARMQVKYIIPVIIEALCSSVILSETKNPVKDRLDPSSMTQDDKTWINAKQILETEIDAIAVTYGPGLIGSLLVGVETAKTLSFVFEKPLIPVNHLLAHLYANFIQKTEDKRQKTGFPFIGLIVSGGHTDLLYFKSQNEYEWLGGTRDDAAGEAFDKIGRLLDLPYPAGPEIERRANLANNPTFKFQSPMIYSKDFDFSFSGLKAEVMRYVKRHSEQSEESNRSFVSTQDDSKKHKILSEELINQICFATQKAILDVLVKKTLNASEKYNVRTVLVGGGVSANQTFIEQLKLNASRLTLNPKIFSPEKIYCTDNAAMIGAYALKNYKPLNWQKVNANPELYFS